MKLLWPLHIKMSLQLPHKIHYKYYRKEYKDYRYVCNWSNIPKEEYMSNDLKKITCGKCKRLVRCLRLK